MKLILRNLTEDIVIDKLDSMIDKLDCCKCDYCRLDIASYALNRLPNKYVATTQGELLSKISMIDNEFSTRVTTELTRAAEVIKHHPRHQAPSLDFAIRDDVSFASSDSLQENSLPEGTSTYFQPIDEF